MAREDWFQDFMDYKLSDPSSGAPGDSGGCAAWILGILFVLWLLSRLL